MIKQMFVKVQINPEQSCIYFGHNRGREQPREQQKPWLLCLFKMEKFTAVLFVLMVSCICRTLGKYPQTSVNIICKLCLISDILRNTLVSYMSF